MENNEYIVCPRCKSRNIAQGQKGFSLGKAAIGGILVGPLGLLAGTSHSKDIKFTCLDCGNKFTADEYVRFKDAKEQKQRRESYLASLPEDRRNEEESDEKTKTAIGCALLLFAAVVWIVLVFAL